MTSWALGLKDEEKEGMWKWYLTGADDGRNMLKVDGQRIRH